MDQTGSTVMTTTPAAPSSSRRRALVGGATAAVGGALATVVPPRKAEAALAPTFRCPKGVPEMTFGDSDVRLAQTFTATRAGDLREVRVAINKPRGAAGNYVV